MGGTLLRLVDQGHEVHVAYQTSGNIAVFDDEAIRFAEFVADYDEAFRLGRTAGRERSTTAWSDFLQNKPPGQVDSDEVQQIKGLIRRGEAEVGVPLAGVPDANAHFMDLPFYETGRVRKKPLGEEDIQLTIDLLNRIQPQQIYAAGDLSRPARHAPGVPVGHFPGRTAPQSGRHRVAARLLGVALPRRLAGVGHRPD